MCVSRFCYFSVSARGSHIATSRGFKRWLAAHCSRPSAAMAPDGMNIYSHDREAPNTPLCGAHRPSSRTTNALLVRPQLGCVNPTTRDLPSAAVNGPEAFQHEYGLRQIRDGVTAGDVCQSWLGNENSKNIEPPPDFKAINKAGIMAGAHTKEQLRSFRASNPIKMKLGSDKPIEHLPYDSNTMFGRPGRASEPMGDLMSHGYRYDWVMQSESADVVAVKRAAKKPAATKSSIGLAASSRAKYATPPPQSAAWKMPKYSNVPSRVGRTG